VLSVGKLDSLVVEREHAVEGFYKELNLALFLVARAGRPTSGAVEESKHTWKYAMRRRMKPA
jgi:hypothetical protein